MSDVGDYRLERRVNFGSAVCRFFAWKLLEAGAGRSDAAFRFLHIEWAAGSLHAQIGLHYLIGQFANSPSRDSPALIENAELTRYAPSER